MEKKLFKKKFRRVLKKKSYVYVFFGDEEMIKADTYSFLSDFVGKPLSSDNDWIIFRRKGFVVGDLKLSNIKKVV
jgi:hypothetical protein